MIRPGTGVGKEKKKVVTGPVNVAVGKKADVKKPELSQFLDTCDYIGAITLLSFEKKANIDRPKLSEWLAYCYWHNGDYRKALETYEELCARASGATLQQLQVSKAACHFALGEYPKADEEAQKAPPSGLQSRLLYHTAQKLNNEERILEMHSAVSDTAEDQLCLAAVQYLRSNYQEATEIYKRLLARIVSTGR
jgi:intraflagellar transport protein 56